MLVARRAEDRRGARGRDEPPECVAAFRALDHVARCDLKHVEHAVEIGGEHAPPLLLRSLDERPPPATADSRIGKARIDPTELGERRLERSLDGRAVADIADARLDRAAVGAQRVGHAEPDAAVAAGHDRDAAS